MDASAKHAGAVVDQRPPRPESARFLDLSVRYADPSGCNNGA